MDRTGKVYLVGVGPGDPDLVTLRALRILEQADVVLYDALVHRDQLARCRPDAVRIAVGKRGGRTSPAQATINGLMRRHALAGRVVARVKGGDPCLFARGSEEALFLRAHGIPFEIVPGVCSPLAAAAYAGVPLTHRDLSSSVAYITATEAAEKGGSSLDWGKLATATQTLVIFMGARRLGAVLQRLMEHGRPPDTPAAAIQWASTPRQRTVAGTVATLAERAAAAGLGAPALVIVGEVVRLREHLRWFDTRPLFGTRVLVTRARDQGGALAAALRDAGAMPVEVSTFRIVPPADPAALIAAARRLASYDAVALTSPSAVEQLFAALRAAGLDARAFGAARVCAIGPRTRAALAARGIRADIVPAVARGTELARAILAHLPPAPDTRVLLPRARAARDGLPDALRAAGVTCDTVVAYDTRPPDAAEARRIRTLVADGDLDAVALTSVSTLDHLVAVLGPQGPDLLGRLVTAAISPEIAAAAARHGIRVDLVPEVPAAEALVEALIRHRTTAAP